MKEDIRVEDGSLVTDTYFDEDKLVEDEIRFDIVEYVKEVMPEEEGWLGLTLEEWAKIANRDGFIVNKNTSIEKIKDDVSSFYINFIQVLNKVLYLYGIFGVHYFLKEARTPKMRFNIYIGLSYYEMLDKMEYEMGWFNQQFIKF